MKGYMIIVENEAKAHALVDALWPAGIIAAVVEGGITVSIRDNDALQSFLRIMRAFRCDTTEDCATQ